MADAHDKLCEEADVGSLCDCSCAGSKHAIRHTKGGVPGAGAVSKAAQAAAHKDGRAAVINNQAVPKEGSKVSSSAPKSFRDAKPEPGKPEPGKPAGKPISMMSNLSGHTDEELKAAHAAIEAKIKGQGGISGPQRDIQQKIERELAVRGRPLPGNRPDTRGKPVFKGGDAETAKALKGGGNVLDERAAARTKAKFGDATEVTRENTKEGDRVTHVREGKGTVERVGKFGAMTVKFDNGGTKPVMPHEMVKGEHGDGDGKDTENAKDAAKDAGGAASGTAGKGMTVTSRSRNGDAVTEQTKPVKAPGVLRDATAVIANPSAFDDHSAAARYQKLTADHLRAMSPQQKQQMIDDIRSRAKSGGYKKTSATGQKLERGYNNLVFGGSDLKTGMKAADNFQARAGDKVTHPEHGHGKVTTVASVGGKTQGATVDFGDKTVTVPHASLTFGHAEGGDTNTAAKAAAAGGRDQARQAANAKKLTDFAAAAKGPDFLTEFNKISQYPPATFQALPAADKQKVVDALNTVFDRHGSTDVKKRVAQTLQEWTGKGRDVPLAPAPDHIVQAQRALAGQRTLLPTSMVYGQVDAGSLKDRFTAPERSQMRAQAQGILDKMPADARDRPGLQRFVERIDAIDGPKRDKSESVKSSSRGGPVIDHTKGEGAAAKFQGKQVKPVTAAQQPVLEAVGNGSNYKDERGKSILPRGTVSQLERSGHITTVFSNGNAHLTELGHQKLAAQRGDAVHQGLNEKVAAAAAEHAKTDAAVQDNTAKRGDPLDRDWSRRSHDLQMQRQEAYGRLMLAKRARDEHVKSKRASG